MCLRRKISKFRPVILQIKAVRESDAKHQVNIVAQKSSIFDNKCDLIRKKYHKYIVI